MTPDKTYTGRATINMYRSDCMDLMKGKHENYWQLSIVDPPYGKKPTRNTSNMCSAKRTFESGSDDWDIKPSSEYFRELFNTTKNQIIWGGNYFIDELTPTNCFIVWDKNKSFSAFSDCEMAWTSFKSVARLFKYTWNGMIQEDMKNKQRRIHPTEKPVKLYKWLLTNYANEGDTIFDSHGGSMSIAIACWDLGFDLDICELDSDYFNDAVKRFENHIAQTQLF